MSLSPLVQRSLIAMSFTLFCGGALTSATYYWVVKLDYAARVNGETIRNSELELAFERNMRLYARQGMDLSGENASQFLPLLKENTLNNLIDQRLVAQTAQEMGVFVEKSDIDADYQRILSTNYQDDEARLKRDLSANRMSISDYKYQIEQRLLQEHLKTHLTENLTISDTELKTYYESHPEEFETPEKIAAHHILIKPESENPASDAQAKTKAETIYQELQQGESFETLAKKYSQDDTTRETGGALGSFKRGDMVEAFEKAAWALKANEVSQPIKTQYGYHLIKRGQTIPAEKQSFETAKIKIKDRLLEQKKSEFYTHWLKTQRQQAQIERRILAKTPFSPSSTPSPSP